MKQQRSTSSLQKLSTSALLHMKSELYKQQRREEDVHEKMDLQVEHAWIERELQLRTQQQASDTMH